MVLDNDIVDSKEEHMMELDMFISACINQLMCLV